MSIQLRAVSASAAACVALTIASFGCSTPTTETSVWQSPTYAAGPMKNIAVFGGRMNQTDRRTVEDGFVAALSEYGVHATPSYALFPQGEVPRDSVAIQQALQKRGYDGALVSSLKGVNEQTVLVPGAGWGDFYGAYWGAQPVYAETDQFVRFETTLWNPKTGKMVWSTITETENPTSGANFISSLTKKVVPSLAQAGLIPPGQQGAPVSLGRR